MSTDMTKTIAMQIAHQPSPATDPNIDMILQSLMIDDTDVKRILKGEIQEPLNRFRELIENLNQLIVECYKNKAVDPIVGKDILACVQDGYPLMEKIEKQLARYFHNIPYLLLLSPLTRLSNVDGKKVEALCRKVGIMIGRDKLMSVGDESSFENLNFYDALEILINLAFHESEAGWKAKVVTEEKKTVQTVITDTTGQRKKKWGIF